MELFKLRKLNGNVLEFDSDLCMDVDYAKKRITEKHGNDLEFVTLLINGGNHSTNNHHLFKCECQLEFEDGKVFDFDKDFLPGKIFVIRHFPHFGGVPEAIVTPAAHPRWANVTLTVSKEDLEPKLESGDDDDIFRCVSWPKLIDKDAKQAAAALCEKYPFLTVRTIPCNTAITLEGMPNRVTIWSSKSGTCSSVPDAKWAVFSQIKSIDTFL